MKYNLSFVLLLFVLQGSAQNRELKVTIPNINKKEGQLMIALFNSAEKFLKPGKEYRTVILKISSGTETVSFKDLPVGEYGIAICHDKNTDGHCNTNIFGIPKEGYGFSRNFRPRFSAPQFRDTKVLLSENTDLEISMIY